MRLELCRLLLGVVFVGAAVVGSVFPGYTAEGGVGGLLIAPTRVELNPRQRSAELTLMNRGTKAGTYRLSLVEKRMTDEGQLETVPEGEPTPFSAAAMVRFSPRQVRLEPGATQKVRLLVRRPGDLPDGEYRSHMLIQTLPEPGEAPAVGPGAASGQLSVRLVTMAAVSIPVIVRQGAVSGEVGLADVSLVDPEAAELPPRLRFRLLRKGAASVYGDVEVEYSPVGAGEVRSVGRLRGVALYTPNASRWVELPLSTGDDPMGEGTFRVAYRPPNGDRGKPLAVAELTLR